MSTRAKKPEAPAKKVPLPSIHPGMTVAEILALVPEAQPVLSTYGLHCFDCSFNVSETLEDGYLSHGYPEEEIELLVNDLNDVLRNRPERPATLVVTREGALALKKIIEAEEK